MAFGTSSHIIAQAGLERTILLLLVSEHQNYRYVQLHLAVGIFFFWGSLSLITSTDASMSKQSLGCCHICIPFNSVKSSNEHAYGQGLGTKCRYQSGPIPRLPSLLVV